MVRNITKTAIAGIIAATIGFAGLTAPAQANGQISINFNPTTADQAQAVKLGLGIYALTKGIQGGGGITQNGMNNMAGVLQNGSGNFGVVHQEGNNHNGSLQQHGNANSYGLFQFGKGTNAHVNQHGGQTGLGFVFGW
ncbi:curlin [Pelagibacterium limicola]|uniref:curlin n=1 Tax=Pelagibacterium limicola TaxID=2791022 RepID=UPI0018B01087|nr:curlin [Pelagibacterium limicola]